ncbi:MAG: T9SS type A sorting domain-containing protein [Bacteroidales bacterium]|nr:T9SS type A sorting domain-containing protein [Bacteroidales bacterium]
MKKFYLFLAMLAITGLTFAQVVNKTGVINTVKVKDGYKVHSSQYLNNLDAAKSYSINKKAKSADSRWYSYWSSMQDIVFPSGGGNNAYLMRMFPDTTVLIKYTDGVQPPWIHGIATVLDPTADVFFKDGELDVKRYSSIKLDSIAIDGLYSRHHPDPSIVDTLIVEVVSALTGPIYFFSGMAGDFGYDTVNFIACKYDSKINYLKNKTEIVNTYKILLTAETEFDTIPGGVNEIYVPTPDAPFTTGLVGVTFRFKPGYSWNPYQDTLNTQLNEFMFLTYEEKGSSTFPTYMPDNYNISHVIPSWGLFDASSSWKGFYVPSVAFVVGYVCENHWISFKLSCNNNSIIESQNKTVKLSQNYPNPASDFCSIEYELAGNSDVTFTLTDLAGRQVFNLNQGTQNAGNHNINLNVSSLKDGLYYYTLTAGNEKLTRKMIITK